MIVDFAESRNADYNGDVIIVGAGAVGLTMAIYLARRGIDVTVVEAGPVAPNSDSQAFFQAASASGYDLPGLHLGRFRALGGTTNFWGGQLVPFDQHIFDGRPKIGADPWPIDALELEKYYRYTLDLLGMKNVFSDDQVWAELKTQIPLRTDDVIPYFTRWAPIRNFATLFGNDLVDRENLRVFVNAPVTALTSDDGQIIAGVEVAHADGRRVLLRGRRVILASGTIEIVRLLLLPLSDGALPVWHHNKWLGTGFMDHLDCYAGEIIPYDKKRFSDVFDNAFIHGIKYCPKLRLSVQAQQREGLFDASAHFVFRSAFSDSIEDAKIFFGGLLRGRLNWKALQNPVKSIAAVRYAFPMVLRYLRHRRIYNFSDIGIALRLTVEQSPDSSSVITLRGDTDALGVPNVDVNWRFRRSDISTIARFAEMLREYLAASGLAEVKLDERLVDRDQQFMETIDDANHHMGGARMGHDASLGVVDSGLKVFGTTNLYVAGAAVYPASGFANPTFTAIALGLRLAETIASERGASYVETAQQ